MQILILNSECLEGDCKFYEEVERISSCGTNGYALGHAKHYCDRFESMIDSFDDAVLTDPT